MGSYIAPSGMSKEQAWNEAKTLYGSNLNQSFVWNGQELNAGTGLPMNPTMSAGNNKMPTDVAKSQANLISANKPSGQGFTGLATKYADPTKKKVGKREVSLLQNDPPALMKNTDTAPMAMENIQLSDGSSMAVPAGNVSIDHKTNAVTQLSTVDQEYKPPPGSQVQDVPIYAETSTNLAPGEVREEMKGFLSDEDLLATMQPQSDQPSFSELYNKSRAYDTPAGFDKSIGDFDPSMGNKLLNQSGLGTTGKKAGLGYMDQAPELAPMAGAEAFRSLPHEGVGSSGFFAGAKDMAGKAGDMLGKAGGMMSKAAPGIMAGLNILGEAGAMSARKKAIGSLGKSMADLETTMEQAITSKHAGYEAAEDAFQQGKGLVGKRLTDSMKGAFAGVQGSNIVTGSREKVKKNIRGQVRNQADMAVAGLETEMAKGKAASLTQSRSTRDKAKAAYAEAKAKQKELEQQQKMGPLKMAASVVSVVNPAAGMAMNAGLSLYDAYSS